MASGFRIGWVVLGFASLIGAGPAFAPAPAFGQILDRPQEPEATETRPRATPPSPVQALLRPSIQDEVFDSGAWGTEVHRSAAERAAPNYVARDLAAEELSEAAGEAGLDDSGEARVRLRRLAQDGDLSEVLETDEALRGTIDPFDDDAPLLEDDPTLADLRSPQDIDAFSSDLPGFDPLLLQAEEVNPVFAGTQLGEIGTNEAFAPLGTRIGSFILFTTLEANADYNSNLFASPVALGDWSLQFRPAMRLVSDWANHAVEVRASGDLSYHDRYPSEDDRAYLIETLGRLDVTRQTNLQALYGHEFAQESRSAINALSVGTRPNVVVDRVRGAFNHRFNRLSVQLRGAVIDTSYGTDNLFGVVQSNADRDYTLYEQAFRPQWEFTPTFSIFADLSINQRHYTIPAYSDGIIRSSTGQRYRAGVSFGQLGEYLRGEVSLGYGRQTPDSPLLPIIDGLLIDGALTWRPTPLTTVALTASSEVAETTTTGSGGVMERNYALEARHSVTERLTGIAGVSFFTRDFVGANQTEEQFVAAGGVDYFLNRNAVLFTRYAHTVFDSNTPNSSYTVEEVQFGVRLQN